MPQIQFEVVPFDHVYLTDHPHQKANLLQFYCDIWMFDPNFAEYRKCPVCRKYYSENEVKTLGIASCTGTPTKPHDKTELQEAWTSEIVEKDLQSVLSLGKDFFGAIALIPPHDRVIGFVWGYTKKFPSLSEKWDLDTVSKINSELPCAQASYFSEIASDPSLRGQGIGSALCKSLVSWMKQNYSTIPSMLHTHESSPAYRLFQKAGYRLFTKTSQTNSGRIFMIATQGSILTPENLS